MLSNVFESSRFVAPVKAVSRKRSRPAARDGGNVAGKQLSSAGAVRRSPEIVIGGKTLGVAATRVQRKTNQESTP